MSEESGFNEGEAHELTLDELLEQQVAMDQVKQAEKDLLLPAATYTTVPALKLKLTRNDQGRQFARFFGGIVASLESGEEVKGNVGFSISWERANRLDRETGGDTGKPDNATKLYVQAVAAYKKAYGEAPSTTGDVIKYLRDYPVRVRVIQIGVPTERNPEPDGEAGNMVVAISAPLS